MSSEGRRVNRERSDSVSEGQNAGASRGLTRWQAVPLAIGSVAGSGILFLPSAVYARAGNNSLLVWALSTLLCLPMLLMFDDMVRSNPDGRGIEAFIRAGLGDMFARCVPLMFIALVVVGLPSGTFVAGRYVARTFAMDRAAVIAIGLAVLLAAALVNLAGVRTSTRVQTAASWGLVLMAAALLAAAAPSADHGLSSVAPGTQHLDVVLPGVVLAFWAFAGFENLTFLAREFRAPARDFLPVSAIALAVYGLFTILLTVAIAVCVPRQNVDQVVGLLQLAAAVGHGKFVLWAVTLIACTAMLLNAIAWVWGVSQMARDAAVNGLLPAALLDPEEAGAPRRALGLLCVLFSATSVLLSLRPSLVVDTTAAASAIFMLLYILSIVSYLRVRGLTLRSGLNLLLLVVIAASLVESVWEALYALVAFVAALSVQLLQRRRAPQNSDRTPHGGVDTDGLLVDGVHGGAPGGGDDADL
ncbi:APC family permease [Streptomyces tropicalis]|uniref:APC family permease n=1 Tax=Streptomyces tropicalis TaxID=3034234 RepID=A0ABT6A474_9ACTN|nr:APC family permease [Streptomyces tropicalis]MDF3299447.1 APC family permease [Streptomyces tropicalis]